VTSRKLERWPCEFCFGEHVASAVYASGHYGQPAAWCPTLGLRVYSRRGLTRSS